MCGIAGFIGKSTHPKVTSALMTNLILKTEKRGKEATGIWGTQAGRDGSIIYYKEPVPANEFVKRDMWKNVRDMDLDVLLAHCREPSPNAGNPKTNKNNHPHVSKSCEVALVHNGKVEEYHSLKYKGYKDTIISECDSELILRMFERGEHFLDDDSSLIKKFPNFEKGISLRLYGIEQIFSKLNNGSMAVAIGERQENDLRSLWLFRDDKRPLQLIDLRRAIGQIFFCSMPDIWREAVEATPETKNVIPTDHDIMEIAHNYVYLLQIDPEKPDDANGKKNVWRSGWRSKIFKIVKTKVMGVEEEEVLPPLPERPASSVKIITPLDENGEIVKPKEVVMPTSTTTSLDLVPITPVTERRARSIQCENDAETDSGYDLKKLSDLSESIRDAFNFITTETQNLAMEGSISKSDFEAILIDLEQIRSQLVGIRTTTFSNVGSPSLGEG